MPCISLRSLMSYCQQPHTTLFKWMISSYTRGWPFSMQANVCASCHIAHALCQGNLLFCTTCKVQAIYSVILWLEKTAWVFFFLSKEWSLHLVFGICFPPETTILQTKVCTDCIRLTEGGGQTGLVAMESVSLHQLLSVTVLPRVTNR